MKYKYLFIVAVILAIVTILSGCDYKHVDVSEEQGKNSRFVIVEKTYTWGVVRDKYTGVMYVVSRGTYNSGNFTVLINADGTPMIWEGGRVMTDELAKMLAEQRIMITLCFAILIFLIIIAFIELFR